MSDITVTITPPNSTSVTIGNAVYPHGATHATDGSDSLSSYYYPSNNPSGYVTSGDFATTGYVADVSGAIVAQISFPQNIVFTTGDQNISGAKNFYSRPTVNGTGVLLSGEGGAAVNTGSLTGAFYPLNSNPSGYLTGVDLSNYVTKSSTGSFVTTGQTGVFITSSQTGQFVSTGSTGSFITTSQTGQFVWTGSTGNFTTGAVVRPSDTGIFITTGQTGQFVTGNIVRPSETGSFITASQTGTFYPISNPSGYITGVDLTNYVTKSSTGVFVTTGQTGNFITATQTGQFVSTGATGNFVTGSVVRPNETGSFITSSQTGVFYPISNPSGYITGVDLSNYVTSSQTGQFVWTGDTGNFSTNSSVVLLTGNQVVSGVKDFASRPTVNNIPILLSGEGGGSGAANTGDLTGVFYPLNSNPSGYITGVDLSNYVTQSSTGSFVTTGQTGDFVTGSVVRPSETGSFITSSQTGQFYAASNPSGYSTTGYVIGVSGYLQNQISFVRTGGVSDYYVALTGAQNISGEKSYYNNSIFKSGINLSGKLLFDTGFLPTILDGEASWNNEYGTVQIGMNNGDVLNPVGFKNFYRIKANQDIRKGKVVMSIGTNGNSEFILAQEASNIAQSGELIMGVSAEAIAAGAFGDVVAFGAVKGVDTSAFTSGAILYFNPSSTGEFTSVIPNAPNAKVITAINLNPSSNGTIFVRVSAGSVLGGTDSNVKFTALQNNNIIVYDSVSGIWYNKTLTTGDVSGISAYALAANTGSFVTTSQTGQFVSIGATGSFVTSSSTGAFLTTGAADNRYTLQSATGIFVTTGQTGTFVVSSQTGAFLTTGAADGRYALQSATGAFITSGQTGAFAAAAQTGAFLTTGAADGRYYGLSNGQIISGYAITGFNDAITGMTIVGDTTKTITLFQRGGTSITGSFADNAGTGTGGGGGAGGATNTWIPASAWIPRSTTGCGVDSRELGTNLQNFDELLFDAGTNEFAQALIVMPNNYNNGTVNARFYWTASTGSGSVIWGMQGLAFSDDDVLSGAFGTAQTVTDTLLSINDMHITDATSSITLSGTPAANRPIQLQIYRDAAASGDTLGNDARLLGVQIGYTSA